MIIKKSKTGSCIIIITIVMFLIYLSYNLFPEHKLKTSTFAPKENTNPVPRFVSLKYKITNVRKGPGIDYNISWVFNKKGFPVEVIAEFETWYRIRDNNGKEGWIKNLLLTNKRMAIIDIGDISDVTIARDGPNDASRAIVKIKEGVIGEIKQCNGKWCKFKTKRYNVWVQQDKLWGVYPNEIIN